MSRAGMRAIAKGIEQGRSQPEICYYIAGELRGEVNRLRQAMSQSRPPGVKERARREARIDGMKFALALALGIPLGSHHEAVEEFLEEFREERLNAARSDREAEAAVRRGTLVAESDRVIRGASAGRKPEGHDRAPGQATSRRRNG